LHGDNAEGFEGIADISDYSDGARSYRRQLVAALEVFLDPCNGLVKKIDQLRALASENSKALAGCFLSG